MPKVIKILLINNPLDRMDLISDFARCRGDSWSNPKTNPDMMQATLQVNGEAMCVQIHMVPNRAYDDAERRRWFRGFLTLVEASHVALKVIKLCDQDYQNVDEFVAKTMQDLNSLIRDFLFLPDDYREATADSSYLLPLFHISARAESVESLRSKFNRQGRDLNITVAESKPSFIGDYLKNCLIPAIQNGRIKPKEEYTIFSKISGRLVGAVLGIFTSVFVYNPLASFFAAANGLLKNKSFKDFALLLISPFFGPLYGLFYKGLYLQGRRGWEFGFKKSFNALIDVPRNATLKEKTPISGRNIIASLAIILLSIAAAGSVLISPVSLGLGIPTLVIALGLSGISLPWLALLAGSAALVTTTALYALGVVLADHGFNCNLTRIIRSLSGSEKGTYHRLAREGSSLAPAVSASTLPEAMTREDAIGPRSAPPLASAQPAAAAFQRSMGGDAYEHAFVQTDLPASASAQPTSAAPALT